MSEELSHDERQKYAENIKEFGKLLERGGVIGPQSNLVLEQDTLRQVIVDENLVPQLEAFKQTKEGQVIEEHRDIIGASIVGIDADLGNRVESRAKHHQFLDDGGYTGLKNYAAGNGMKLNLPETDMGVDSEETREKLEDSKNSLRAYSRALYDLELGLIEHPEIRFGSEVSVRRSPRDGKEAYIEPGWTVQGVSGSASLIVANGDLEKPVPLAALLEVQQQAAASPLN